jgi:hypothetical protein
MLLGCWVYSWGCDVGVGELRIVIFLMVCCKIEFWNLLAATGLDVKSSGLLLATSSTSEVCSQRRI